jgi:hypothetical protein
MISLTGLTPLQRELCETIWNLESTEEIAEWFATLDITVRPIAHVMLQMIMFEYFDSAPLEDLSQAQEIIHHIQSL